MQSCTLVCPAADFVTVVEVLEETAGVPLVIDGPREAWRSIELVRPSGRLRLTSLTADTDPEKYRRICLGTSSFFRIIERGPAGLRRFLIDASLAAPLFIGVVADPPFSEEDDRLDCLFATAVWMHALVFTGSGMLAPTGHLLLDAEGRSEVSVDPDTAARFRACDDWPPEDRRN